MRVTDYESKYILELKHALLNGGETIWVAHHDWQELVCEVAGQVHQLFVVIGVIGEQIEVHRADQWHNIGKAATVEDLTDKIGADPDALDVLDVAAVVY